MADIERSTGESEAVRRKDGGGETSPLPGSETARGNKEPENKGADEGFSTETWTPGEGDPGIRPGSPAGAAIAAGKAEEEADGARP